MTRLAVLQMNSGIDPSRNAAVMVTAIAEAARGGATMLFTPEMSGMLDRDRARSAAAIRDENDDGVLCAVCDAARAHEMWVNIGSLAVKAGNGSVQRANRSFVIDDRGEVVARYDKIHLFDVDLATGESWRESAAYRAGEKAVVVETPVGLLGLSICYDLRFPKLYAALSEAGATVLSIPAAFTVPTGRAHWHILMQARAIENACYVVAAAQTGLHEDGRTTFGHALVVDPWGEVMLDMGDGPGLAFCNIDRERVSTVRNDIPVIEHRRAIAKPELY